MKRLPMAWIIEEEWPSGPADPDAHGWSTPIEEVKANETTQGSTTARTNDLARLPAMP